MNFFLKTLMIIFFYYKSSIYASEIFTNLSIENILNANNSTIFYGGIKNTFYNIFFNGHIIINTNSISLGNNNKKTRILFNYLPVGSKDVIIPYKYIMIGEKSNQVYIGHENSPLPPPDFITFDNLKTNFVVVNYNLSELNFNKFINEDESAQNDILIGNNNIITVINANNLNLYNSELLQKNYKSNSPNQSFIKFNCPIIFKNNIIVDTININNNVICNNNSKITIYSNSVEYNDLNLNSDVVFGNNNLESIITLNKSCRLQSNKIEIGNQDYPISMITNIPIKKDATDFFYLLAEKNSNNIFITKDFSDSIIIDTINTEELKTNIINNNTNTNTSFKSKSLFLNGNIIANIDLNLSNITFNNKIYFNNTVNIEESIPFYFICQKNIIINSGNLTIENSIFNEVHFFSKNNIFLGNYITYDSFNYLSINSDNKLCKNLSNNESLLNIEVIEKDISKISNNIESYKNTKKDIKKIIKNNNAIKKVIKLLQNFT